MLNELAGNSSFFHQDWNRFTRECVSNRFRLGYLVGLQDQFIAVDHGRCRMKDLVSASYFEMIWRIIIPRRRPLPA